MTAFRILSQSPVYFLLDGVTPAANGYLKFYEAGTTTAKDVYGDQALTVNNGSTISLGSDGRAVDDIWGSGSYRVRVYASDDTLISDDDDVEVPGGTGTSIPALAAGKLLSNDGAVLQWADVVEVPDPTGQSGRVLSSDGSNAIWIDKPADGAGANITITSSTASIGGDTGDKFYVQSGNATAPASGINTTTKAVSFGTTFKALIGVMITPTSTNVTAAGFNAIPAISSQNTSGFTVQFDINESSGSYDIVNDVSFKWVAFGTIA